MGSSAAKPLFSYLVVGLPGLTMMVMDSWI